MNLKTLLLASAAVVFAGATVAQAADIPDPSDNPVEASADKSGSSVDVCDVAGAGFFYIPGTKTCLKIGGGVEATVGYASIGDGKVYKDSYAKVEARMDVDTHTDSEIGAIGSKLRLSVNHPFLGGVSATGDDFGLELAYLTVGPAYVGFKETLFNTQVAYGDTFDIENYFGGHLNTLTAGAMIDNIGGGFYAGGAVEGSDRGQWVSSYHDAKDVDFVGRAGIAGQSWGSSDLSAWYSKSNDFWTLKSTTDVNVLDGTQGRVTVAYFNQGNDDAALVGVGAKHAFTEQVSGFAGFGYLFSSALDNPYMANAGVVYSPAEGFDVTGEFGYGDLAGTANYNTQVKFSKSF